MQAIQANVLVDIKQAVSPERGKLLSSTLGALPGVSRAWVSPRSGRLVLVDYNPEQMNARQLLGALAGQGCDARLVGL